MLALELAGLSCSGVPYHMHMKYIHMIGINQNWFHPIGQFFPLFLKNILYHRFFGSQLLLLSWLKLWMFCHEQHLQ